MAASWYLRKGVKQYGPYTPDQIRDLAGQGKIAPNDLLWRDRPEKGAPASQFEGLGSLIASARAKKTATPSKPTQTARPKPAPARPTPAKATAVPKPKPQPAAFQTIEEPAKPEPAPEPEQRSPSVFQRWLNWRVLLPVAMAVAAVLFIAFAIAFWPSDPMADPHPTPARAKARAAQKKKEVEARQAKSRYETHIGPFFSKYCYRCHGNEKQKAELNLEALADRKASLKAPQTWIKVISVVRSEEMPFKKPYPTPEERKEIIAWASGLLDEIDRNTPPDPGRIVLRRLNKVEYTNTVRDLFGVNFKPAEAFPSDDVGHGFDNNGEVLTLSPLLLEKYLAAAGDVLDKAVVTKDWSKPEKRLYQAEAMKVTGGATGSSDMLVMYAAGEAFAMVDFPMDANYLVRVKAGADQAGNEPAKMAWNINGKTQKVIEVKVSRNRQKTYEHKLRFGKGRTRFAVGFINDYYNPQAPDRRQRDRNLILDWVEIVGPVDVKPPEPPVSHKRIFVAKPGKGKPSRDAARKVLQAFVPRAFRRPATKDEIDRYLRLYDAAEKQGETFESAMKLPLKAVLVSPHFLFRVEKDRPTKDPRGVHRIGDLELASRLSYFIWSTMPDEELLSAAKRGKLHEPKVLEAQMRRMLKDPKARALADNFAVQWLQIGRLDEVMPDRKTFPKWNDKLRRAMKEEAVLFFQALMKEDRSLLELLEADFTFVNEPLAQLYGIQDVKGDSMKRVSLKDSRRGGIVTMASVLTTNANPTRTSPVLRGKWIMDILLGTPPADPPDDVPPLPTEPEDMRKTLRERLEIHRKDPTCASCHMKMDPLGMALENYDGIGGWRDKDAGKPIDDSAVLPDGHKFAGAKGLKQVLMSQKDLFVRNVVAKMLTYALGRGVEYGDRRFINEISSELAKGGYKFSTLVRGIVKSYPFQYRKVRKG